MYVCVNTPLVFTYHIFQIEKHINMEIYAHTSTSHFILPRDNKHTVFVVKVMFNILFSNTRIVAFGDVKLVVHVVFTLI